MGEIIVVLLLLCNQIIFCQIYTSVDDYGWDSGITYSRPLLIDLNNDGFLEGLIGESDGGIYYYEQDIINPMQFHLISKNFSNINVGYSASPTLYDIDNDGLYDLIIGNSNGYLYHFEQESIGTLNFIFISDDFNNIGDIGTASTPILLDIDNDGLIDLLIGESWGNLNHWEQDSVNSYSFQFLTDQFNNIQIGEYDYEGNWLGGQIRPTLSDIDDDNLLDLVIGSGFYNRLFHYEQNVEYSNMFSFVNDSINDITSFSPYPYFIDIDYDNQVELILGSSLRTNMYTFSNGSFQFQSGMNFGIDIGSGTQIAITDLNYDNLNEIIALEPSFMLDNINLLQKEESTSFNYNIINENWASDILGDIRSIFAKDIDNDGNTDIFVKNQWYEPYKHFEYINENQITFISNNFNGIGADSHEIQVIEDIDNDGLLDILLNSMHTWDGMILHYEQQSINSNYFSFISNNFAGISTDSYSDFCISDVDDDGLKDFFLQTYIFINYNYEPFFYHFEQLNENSYDFIIISENFKDVENNKISSFNFADLNNDGLEDIIIGQIDGGIKILKRNQFTLCNFRASITEGQPPLIVQFFDNSTSDVVSWEWDFNGDEIIDSVEPNPQFTYSENGVYNVSLRVESLETDDFELKENFITVSSTNVIDDNIAPNENNLTNFPNPFNPNTIIRFSLSDDSFVNLSIYNLKGQEVSVLINEMQKKGKHSITWNGTNNNNNTVSSGIYFIKLFNDNKSVLRKCVLLK